MSGLSAINPPTEVKEVRLTNKRGADPAKWCSLRVGPDLPLLRNECMAIEGTKLTDRRQRGKMIEALEDRNDRKARKHEVSNFRDVVSLSAVLSPHCIKQ